MARASRRYPLLLYTRMMDRWSPLMLFGAIGHFGLAYTLHMYYPQPEHAFRWQTMVGVGGLLLLNALMMALFRKGAYVQARKDHLRLATPFLRLNISYKRIKRSSSATIAGLFSTTKLSGWKLDILEPLARKTAIVVELNGYPISQQVLRFFLSPFFFKDKTPHFVLLVDDWMRFSAELESMRAGGGMDQPKPQRRVDKSILSRLPHQ